MDISKQKPYKALFAFAAIYDIILGLTFLFFFTLAFEILGIPEKAVGSEPYLSLIGAFLFMLGIAYYMLFRSDLNNNRALVLTGALFKLAYVGVALWYYVIDAIPHITFLSVFGVLDLFMFIFMLKCWADLDAKN